MKVLKGEMAGFKFDLGYVGEDTEFTDTKGIELKVGDVVKVSKRFYGDMVETVIFSSPVTGQLYALLDEEDKKEFLTMVKEDIANEKIMKEETVTIITKYVDLNHNCVLGFGEILKDCTLEDVAKATKYITKLDMGLEEFINSPNNQSNVFIEEE